MQIWHEYYPHNVLNITYNEEEISIDTAIYATNGKLYCTNIDLYLQFCKSLQKSYIFSSQFLLFSYFIEKTSSEKSQSCCRPKTIAQNALPTTPVGLYQTTIDAIANFLQELLKSYEKKEHALTTFLDLSKALDTIDINILITKIEHYGIRGRALGWFKNYSSNKCHYVNFLNYLLNEQSLKDGD